MVRHTPHPQRAPASVRRTVGERVYRAYGPDTLYNHDAEDPDMNTFVGTTDRCEEVEINTRAAESDLIVYVKINIVAMDGGWKSTATGLSSYRAIRHHHTVKTMEQSKSFMDRHNSEHHNSN